MFFRVVCSALAVRVGLVSADSLRDVPALAHTGAALDGFELVAPDAAGHVLTDRCRATGLPGDAPIRCRTRRPCSPSNTAHPSSSTCRTCCRARGAAARPLRHARVPDPSMSRWRRGSTSSSKIASGGAAITRSTDLDIGLIAHAVDPSGRAGAAQQESTVSSSVRAMARSRWSTRARRRGILQIGVECVLVTGTREPALRRAVRSVRPACGPAGPRSHRDPARARAPCPRRRRARHDALRWPTTGRTG